MDKELPAGGWVAISRDLLHNWVWTGERYSRGQAWVELILLACWADDTTLYRGQLVHIGRGQVRASINWLAKRWGWDPKTVDRFLKQLTDDGMVTVEKSRSMGTVITLKNYEKWQFYGERKGEQKSLIHGEAEKSPELLETLTFPLSNSTADGEAPKGQKVAGTGEQKGEQKGERTGKRINNINNNNNFKKEEGPADRLEELRRKRDKVLEGWKV